MRRVIPVLAAALIASLGASSAAHAKLINFAVDAVGGTLSYLGPTLSSSTAFDLDGATLEVSAVDSPLDLSGLAIGDTVTVTPTFFVYGSGSGSSPLPFDIVKTWTATTGADIGDVFTETLTGVLKINRASANAITVYLDGTVSDTDGLFTHTPAFFILQANQVGGPGTVIASSFTNTTKLGAIPEPSTWAMVLLGFAGLGYAAFRRGAKSRVIAQTI